MIPFDIKQIVEEQRLFFKSNQTKEVAFRIAQLRLLKKLISSNEALLSQAIYNDFQKSSFDNYTNELALVYHDIDEAIKKVAHWARKKKVSTNWINFPARSYILPEPLGVCLVIGAWNYPYQLSFAPIVAALAAGNTVILKPSELPAHTSSVMANIINSNFDPRYLKVVEGGVAETAAILEQRFDKIFFTGSVPVGKIVYQAAAQHLTPVTLELGGKSPAIITEDCDLPMAAKRLVWGKFLNAGQTCIAPDYVLVHQSVEEQFLLQAKAEIEKENYAIANGNYVQIINDKNVHRLIGLLDTAKVYCGGQYDLATRVISPTIMRNITFDDKVMQEEIFGPLLPVIVYDDLETAIALIKARPKPLSCYIFTKDTAKRDKVLHEISFGGGAVNEVVMHIANSNLAFGGVGESGIGAYHGENGFRTFSHYKSILEKSNWLELDLKYAPHTSRKLKLIKFIMQYLS